MSGRCFTFCGQSAGGHRAAGRRRCFVTSPRASPELLRPHVERRGDWVPAPMSRDTQGSPCFPPARPQPFPSGRSASYSPIARNTAIAVQGAVKRLCHSIRAVSLSGGSSVLVTEIFEQRGERRSPVPDGAAAKPALRQVVAPRDDVGARHGAKLLRADDAGEAHEIPHRVFVGAAGAGVTEFNLTKGFEFIQPDAGVPMFSSISARSNGLEFVT